MKYISISGPVASGKSTLLYRLQAALGDRAAVHLERPDRNPYISDYYSDSKRWSFHSQVAFLSLYFDDLADSKNSWLHSGADYYLFDRSLTENLVIARYRLLQGDITEEEYRLLEKLATGIEQLMPPIDAYLCIDCSETLMLQRLKERGRAYEQQLDADYARKQIALYREWEATLPQEKVFHITAGETVPLEPILRYLGELKGED